MVTPIQEKSVRRPIVSFLDEARLLNKVEPVYPRIAVLTHRQGDVKLHAFIAKDGTIEERDRCQRGSAFGERSRGSRAAVAVPSLLFEWRAS